MHFKKQPIIFGYQMLKSVYFVDLCQNNLTIIPKNLSISEISSDNLPKENAYFIVQWQKMFSSTRSLKD